MAVGNPGKLRLNIGQRFLQTSEAKMRVVADCSRQGKLYRAAKDGDIEGVAAACALGAKLDATRLQVHRVMPPGATSGVLPACFRKPFQTPWPGSAPRHWSWPR